MDRSIEKLAEAWIRLQSKKHIRDSDPDIDVLEAIDSFIRTDPGQVLILLDVIFERVESRKIIGSTGAGPLEDLLGSVHGKDYASAVFERARKDKKWRLAFGCVWTSGFKDREVAAMIEHDLSGLFPNGRP